MKRLSNRQKKVMAIIGANGPMTVSRLIPLIHKDLYFNTISTVVRDLNRIGFLYHNNEFRLFMYYTKILKDEYINPVTSKCTQKCASVYGMTHYLCNWKNID